LFRDEHAEEQPEDEFCLFGHEAVTLRKDRPVDEIQITLRPAAVIADAVKNQVVGAGKYWLVLSDVAGGDERVSEHAYLWREVMVMAEKFHGHAKEAAWALWNKMRP
jgi:hypothetical protein